MMTLTTDDLESLAGSYMGQGRWRDDAGGEGAYHVTHNVEVTEKGPRVSFHHIFDNGDPDVEAAFNLEWSVSPLLAVKAGDAVIGSGYVAGALCHYTLQLGDKIVESTFQPHNGGLRVYGSSSKNADGNFIAWSEVLERR